MTRERLNIEGTEVSRLLRNTHKVEIQAERLNLRHGPCEDTLHLRTLLLAGPRLASPDAAGNRVSTCMDKASVLSHHFTRKGRSQAAGKAGATASCCSSATSIV